MLSSVSLTQTTQEVEEITALVYKSFIRPMRTLMPPAIARAHYHISIEGNNNWTIGGHVAKVFMDYAHDDTHRCTFTRSRTDPAKIGFWTTHQTKENGVNILHSIIRGNNLVFDLNFFGHKDVLYDQLTRLRKVQVSTNLSTGVKYIITAKTIANAGIDNQDDQAISLLIAVYASHDWIDSTNIIPSKRIRMGD